MAGLPPSTGGSTRSSIASTRGSATCSATSTRSTAAWTDWSRSIRPSSRRSGASRPCWPTSEGAASYWSGASRRSSSRSPGSRRESRRSSSGCASELTDYNRVDARRNTVRQAVRSPSACSSQRRRSSSGAFLKEHHLLAERPTQKGPVSDSLELGRRVADHVDIDGYVKKGVKETQSLEHRLLRLPDHAEVQIREEVPPAPRVGAEEADASDALDLRQQLHDPPRRLVELLHIRQAFALDAHFAHETSERSADGMGRSRHRPCTPFLATARRGCMKSQTAGASSTSSFCIWT